MRFLKVSLFACLALVGYLCAAPSHAATYSNAAATFNFIATNTHTPITRWPDCGGVDYTQVRIHTNGRLQFNNTACGQGTIAIGPPRTYPRNLPDASQDRSLRIYGADLDVSTSGGGAVTFATRGTAPNRIFVVTSNNASQWKAGDANNFGDGTRTIYRSSCMRTATSTTCRVYRTMCPSRPISRWVARRLVGS